MYYRGLWYTMYPNQTIKISNEKAVITGMVPAILADSIVLYRNIMFHLKNKEVLKEIYDLANNSRNKQSI